MQKVKRLRQEYLKTKLTLRPHPLTGCGFIIRENYEKDFFTTTNGCLV